MVTSPAGDCIEIIASVKDEDPVVAPVLLFATVGVLW